MAELPQNINKALSDYQITQCMGKLRKNAGMSGVRGRESRLAYGKVS